MALSVVLPTFNRAAALRETLGPLLEMRGVDEVVVVDDGSTDDTPEVLAAVAGATVADRAAGGAADERSAPGSPTVRIVALGVNRGAPAARNAGAELARGRWLLFAEDDCRFPRDFASVLLEEAAAHGADVVGAPMVHPAPGQTLAAAVRDARRWRPAGGIDAVAQFPARPVVTPLLPAPSLVRRELVLRLGFDEGYRGNAYREETDFYLRAAAAGAVCVLTPRTFFWEPARWPGGQVQRSRVSAELWTLRNNWRFLRRHAQWLRDERHISSPLAEQAAFAVRRMRRMGPHGAAS